MNKGTLYFFTGLSGAGKTTLGTLFANYLRTKNPSTFLLDSEDMHGITPKADYSTESRLDNARRIFKLCKLITNQGIDVVCCSISMYKEVRQWNRENFPDYVEIYVNASMDTLKKVNKKNLYSGEVKDVVGVDLPCDYPEHPDVEIHNDRQETPEAIVEKLIRKLGLV